MKKLNDEDRDIFKILEKLNFRKLQSNTWLI